MENLTPAQKQLYDWLVEYINTNKHSPSIREMMKAMNLRSPAPIQSRLEKMRKKGYLEWTEGQARTLKILKNYHQGLPLLGKVKDGGVVESFSDEQEKIDFGSMFPSSTSYVLQVDGDSMISAYISDGDYLVMGDIEGDKSIKAGEIVTVKAEGYGTMVKRIDYNASKTILTGFNPEEEKITIASNKVEIEGVLLAVFRLNQ
ncbi:transcriptional repressor LexA [Cyanobacterium aponinum UTEX 3222]|uniref:SOS-response transcriptional repressor, LexA n=1 Tax=Cyanobacterium aponinum (strain PCC 10605) TaxID=755178 RepID=K9Z643_CYAAP|nr:transcriptional repressor LexA [Cyanobacterium aponinum]AFZ54614.1 SOS-response transcriptional repressor, LexA [Cyanobacterium aponinum PCC 10605]WRL37092.1 transcriptional repressor LexA [Cyanobacterium aponinum UTEX 3221]WRL43439.1 transcriptional repressor LexA [Cyanobacterium aponinum UTEX 3222]